MEPPSQSIGDPNRRMLNHSTLVLASVGVLRYMDFNSDGQPLVSKCVRIIPHGFHGAVLWVFVGNERAERFCDMDG